MTVLTAPPPPGGTRRGRCARPGCRRRTTRLTHCRAICHKVHTVALAIAAREKAPRGRNLAADAREIMRLLGKLGEFPRGNVFTRADMKSLATLKNAYSARNA